MSERVEKRYRELLEKEPYIDSERAVLYTDYIKEHFHEHPSLLVGGATKHILSNLTPVIWDGELLVGSMSRYFKGTQVYPEYETWMLEGFQNIKREEERYIEGSLVERKGDRLGIYLIHPEDKERILEVAKFWEGRDWRSKSEKYLKELMPEYDIVEKWQQQLVFLRFMYDVPDGRVIVDYQKVIDGGIKSLLEQIDKKIGELGIADNKEALERYNFYMGTRLALEGVVKFAENYANEAERLAHCCTDMQKKKELLELARICRKVPYEPADTFREAVQSFWFIHVCLFIELNGRGISPGRMDQYLIRPLNEDIKNGTYNQENALELMQLLRIKCSEITKAHATFTESYLGGSVYQNVTLGGTDLSGNALDNEVSRLILRAEMTVKTWQPTLSIRWNETMSHDFKEEAVNAIREGTGYPALFSDLLAQKRFMAASGAAPEDANNWAPCGCVDMQMVGNRFPMYAIPHTNNLKILELILNNGVNPVTGDKLIQTSKDIEAMTYEEIEAEYIRVTKEIVQNEEICCNIIMAAHRESNLFHLIMSALLDDCIENGKHAYDGGCRYNDSPYVISCGMVNVANSLEAIRENVYEKKRFTMAELKKALSSNFEGFDETRAMLLNSPKYGNDISGVDGILARLYDAWSESAESVNNWLGEPWRASTLSVTTQVLHGKACGATPDGRFAGQFVSDGALSAYPGTDISGPTNLIRSAVKVNAEHLQSTLFNMKFHPAAMEGAAGRNKFITLNDVYFKLGGYQIQYNIVDSKVLRDARSHPEKYQDLMIRVAGFTARYVDLGPDIQEQIIKRTEFESI
jgi:indoleacetate decarboxylase